jgi:hypothetical protein
MHRRMPRGRVHREIQIVNCAAQGGDPPLEQRRMLREHLLGDCRIPGIKHCPNGLQRHI